MVKHKGTNNHFAGISDRSLGGGVTGRTAAEYCEFHINANLAHRSQAPRANFYGELKPNTHFQASPCLR